MSGVKRCNMRITESARTDEGVQQTHTAFCTSKLDTPGHIYVRVLILKFLGLRVIGMNGGRRALQ